MRLGFFTFLASLLLIPSHATAQTNFILPAGSFVKKKDPVSKQVDLSRYFLSHIDQQESGSCHIYAATSLIESFCAQVTGKKIDLSEAYFFYRHLRQSLENSGIAILSSGNVLGKVQGGQSVETLKRFKNGSVCTKDEFGLDENGVISAVKSLQAYAVVTTKKLKADYERDNAQAIANCKSPETIESELNAIRLDYSRKFNTRLCTRMDNQVKCKIPAANLNPKHNGVGAVVKTNNPFLKQCMKAVDRIYIDQDPSASRMAELLDRGYPFVCRGSFVAAPGSGYEDEKMDLEVGHAFIVYGYKKNKTSHQVEFLVRDSNSSKPMPYTVTGCDEVLVIVGK